MTSTTHDDENAAVSGAVDALSSESKLVGGAGAAVTPNNDDLKVINNLFSFLRL